jgi:hypothetical protein
MCPRCPVSVHLHCTGVRSVNDFQCCSHHRCSSCDKNGESAGGLLYPCHACGVCYCEDCLPGDGVTFLGRCDVFEELGFDSTKNRVYINCSKACEKYAKTNLSYKPNREGNRQICPERMDVSHNFGMAKEGEKVSALVASSDSRSGTTASSPIPITDSSDEDDTKRSSSTGLAAGSTAS